MSVAAASGSASGAVRTGCWALHVCAECSIGNVATLLLFIISCAHEARKNEFDDRSDIRKMNEHSCDVIVDESLVKIKRTQNSCSNK